MAACTVPAPSLRSRVTVDLSMCGQNALFAARVGDWTWQTVARQCGLDVNNARNQAGDPAYLAFSYFHIQASNLLHPLGLAIGDDLGVVSQAFGCGSQAVAVVHRISRAQSAISCGHDFLSSLEPCEHPRHGCLYIENLNRWVIRGRRDGNIGLASSPPADFDHGRLPVLPAHNPLRTIPSAARRWGSLARVSQPRLKPIAAEYTRTYEIDPSRDLNGVGLIYFAAYFAFIDSALLAYSRHLGRPDRSFLERRVIDHKLCYYGNTNPDATLSIVMRLYADLDHAQQEVADIVVRDHADGRLLAMCAIRSIR